MTVSYGFYNSLSGDRKYDALQISSMFDGVIADGVFLYYGGHLLVSPDTGTNMNVVVASGRAWFNHTWTLNDANLVLTLDPAESILNRIDAVVIEVDSSDAVRANSIKVIKGAPASDPSAPVMVNTSTKHQYPLCHVYVGAGVTGITIGMITIKIGTSDCPFSAGLIQTLTINDLYARWEAEQDDMLAANQVEFDTWFNNLVDQLTGTQVTNLQNQITTLQAQSNGWIPDSHTWTYSGVDGSTGVVNIQADVTGYLKKGDRIKFDQSHPLTAYWDLNANSLSQVGSFPGTDTAITYSAGKFSNAATFNGTSSKIVIADNAALKPTGDFTIGGWVKTSVLSTVKTIFQSYSQNTNFAGIYISVSSNNVISVFIGKNTGTTVGTDGIGLSGLTNIADGNHHYWVVTFRNNYLQIYVDGRLENSGYCFAPVYGGTNYVRVGCGNNVGSDNTYMNGQIDDLFIINGYALDEETIKAKYQSNTPQGSSDIVVTKKAVLTVVGNFTGVYTPITFWCGLDHALKNDTITNPYFSYAKVPFGFNPSPDKWNPIVSEVINKTKTAATANVAYGQTTPLDGGMFLPSITIPIGEWELYYECALAANLTGTILNCYVTLSTSTSTESDKELTGAVNNGGASGALWVLGAIHKQKTLRLLNKTQYYMLIWTTVANTNLYVYGSGISSTVIRIKFAYL